MNYNISMEIEIKIGKIRYDKKLTLIELSKLSGIPKSTLYDIEVGNISPRLAHLEKIAKALNVRINDLFESEFQ